MGPFIRVKHSTWRLTPGDPQSITLAVAAVPEALAHTLRRKEIPEWVKPGPHVGGGQNLIPPSTPGERKGGISTTYCMKGMAWWYGMR